MNMRFWWLKDRVQQGQFSIYWAPGDENFADYFTKHHSPAHHTLVRPIYQKEESSTSDLQGCVERLKGHQPAGSRSRAQGLPGKPFGGARTCAHTPGKPEARQLESVRTSAHTPAKPVAKLLGSAHKVRTPPGKPKGKPMSKAARQQLHKQLARLAQAWQTEGMHAPRAWQTAKPGIPTGIPTVAV